MNTTHQYQISRLAILDIDGQDAAQILHNLTTNEVKTLTATTTDDGTSRAIGCESFITDVRGKTLGHVYVFRSANGYRLIGAAGQSEAIAAHADKYTIREDAQPIIRDVDYLPFVVGRDLAQSLGCDFAGEQDSAVTNPPRSCVRGDGSSAFYEVDWLGSDYVLMLAPLNPEGEVEAAISPTMQNALDESEFHSARTVQGFPWYGIDLSDKNLPQEADRDALAICFTKGCYLGQETVARLDALGQVQKKLVRWSVDRTDVAAGTEVREGDKVVGRLSSVAPAATDGLNSIGIARRSHFDPGSTATGTAADGSEFKAVVLP